MSTGATVHPETLLPNVSLIGKLFAQVLALPVIHGGLNKCS